MPGYTEVSWVSQQCHTRNSPDVGIGDALIHVQRLHHLEVYITSLFEEEEEDDNEVVSIRRGLCARGRPPIVNISTRHNCPVEEMGFWELNDG